jgi:hypothetical protein
MKIYYITAWRYNPEDLDFYQGVWSGRACSTHERDEKCIQNFGPKTSNKETTWKI